MRFLVEQSTVSHRRQGKRANAAQVDEGRDLSSTSGTRPSFQSRRDSDEPDVSKATRDSVVQSIEHEVNGPTPYISQSEISLKTSGHLFEVTAKMSSLEIKGVHL